MSLTAKFTTFLAIAALALGLLMAGCAKPPQNAYKGKHFNPCHEKDGKKVCYQTSPQLRESYWHAENEAKIFCRQQNKPNDKWCIDREAGRILKRVYGYR
jgi:hypothetical protein